MNPCDHCPAGPARSPKLERRKLLRLGTAASMVMLLSGHTPYGQWVVYRKKYPLIGCHRGDPETYTLAKRIEETLAEHLPAAKARVARAPHAGRLASLLGTDQLEVAVVGRSDARAMLQGSRQFAPYGPIELRLILPLGEHLLLSRKDFPEKHAWLVADALSESALILAPVAISDPAVPWHPGSRAFFEGQGEPAAD